MTGGVGAYPDESTLRFEALSLICRQARTALGASCSLVVQATPGGDDAKGSRVLASDCAPDAKWPLESVSGLPPNLRELDASHGLLSSHELVAGPPFARTIITLPAGSGVLMVLDTAPRPIIGEATWRVVRASAYLTGRVLDGPTGGVAARAAELAFTYAGVGLVVQTLSGEKLAINAAAKELLPAGQNAIEFPGGVESGAEWPLFVELLRGKRRQYSVDRAFGAVVSRLTVTTAATSGGDILTVHALTDVTDTERAIRDLQVKAFRDPLTGLPNRRLFEDRVGLSLSQAERQGRTDAIVFLDLDRLKLVNDTLGHAGGDELLRQVAARLSKAVRRGDTVARLGGDEFTLLLPGIGPDALDAMMTKLLERIAQPFQISGSEVQVTASLGVALYPTHGREANALLELADAALYRSKSAGRNTYRIADSASLAPAPLREALGAALSRGEFSLAYQPKLDLRTGRIVGMEALLRWRHPHLGPVPPMTFIPALEADGGIHCVGAWVLEQAVAQARRWRDRALRVSVNVSTLQLTHPDFVTTVREGLSEHGVSGDLLELEIAQTTLLRSLDGLKPGLSALRDLGVGLAVDDFAADEGSLDLIRRLPVTSVNVGQAFVRQAGVNAGQGVLGRVIRAAGHLGLRTLAVGLETPRELEVLRDLGCDFGQGYLFAPPMTAEAADGFVA